MNIRIVDSPGTNAGGTSTLTPPPPSDRAESRGCRQLPAVLSIGKTQSDTTGEISGIASTRAVDLQDEMVLPTAFTKSLRERPRIAFMSKHFAASGDVLDLIGVCHDMFVDGQGLHFRASLNGSEKAQLVRQAVLTSPEVVGASIGFRPIRNKRRTINGKRVLVHSELKLVEICATLRPAVPATLGTLTAKTEDAPERIYRIRLEK